MRIVSLLAAVVIPVNCGARLTKDVVQRIMPLSGGGPKGLPGG